jgi:hypothetical protein
MQQLPRDPDEQLRLGLRIVESAYDERSRHLDHELQQLRAYSKQQASQVSTLERRVAELEQQVRDGDERARQLSDEKSLVSQELKDTQRDLSKLDAFKRSIMQSIQQEDQPIVGGGGGGGGGGGFPGFTAAAAATPSAAISAASLPSYCTETASMPTAASSYPASPAAHAFGSAAMSSALGSGARVTSPAPMSRSPGGGEAPNPAAVMDGKDFFRNARLRLTYDQFNQFLSNIKRLNDHAQTRDETLARAQEIFGAENDDLFVSFNALLSKHGLT